MRGDAAGLSVGVLVVTGLVVGVEVGLIVLAIFLRGRDYGVTGIVAVVLLVLIVWSLLRAPVAYQLSSDTLTVQFRVGFRQFGPVVSCRPAEEPVSFAVRVRGNGGLFGVTGLYRDKRHGRFRAFVTDPGRLVLVRTADEQTIVISPANAAEWVYSR